MKYLLLIMLFFVVFTVMPLAFIWALNTLFPVLAIPYTLSTWAAAFLLSLALGSSKISAGKK